MIRRGIKPRFRIGTDLPIGRHEYRRVLPFRRSWIAISFLAVMDIVFLIPLISTFQHASSEWGKFDSLFDLVMAMFLSAWMLGWSMAPLLMTAILALMLFGREVVRVRPGTLELFIGLPGVGISAMYDVAKMRNLRREQPVEKSGTSWRGSHLLFDYGANQVGFGSAIDELAAQDLIHSIEATGGTLIRKGEARPEDLQVKWETGEEVSVKPDPIEVQAEQDPVTLTSPSSLALIIANLVPVAGTLFLGWKLSDVMVLYWAESAIIGFFNLFKIIVIGRWGALFFGPFFIGHFGGFMSIHFLFIYSLFVVGMQNDMSSGGDLAVVGQLFLALWPALAALFFSHAYSFVTNFMGRQEYRGKTMSAQMGEPYSRIIFMHLVLIFGGGLAMFLKEPGPVILIVIALKIYFDLKAHMKERVAKSSKKTA